MQSNLENQLARRLVDSNVGDSSTRVSTRRLDSVDSRRRLVDSMRRLVDSHLSTRRLDSSTRFVDSSTRGCFCRRLVDSLGSLSTRFRLNKGSLCVKVLFSTSHLGGYKFFQGIEFSKRIFVR